MNIKNILINGIIKTNLNIKEFSPDNFKDYQTLKDCIEWESRYYFNILDDKRIRSININRIKDILTERDINFKINAYLIGSFADRVEEIELIA